MFLLRNAWFTVHVNHSPIHANLDLFRKIKELICCDSQG